MKGLTVKTETAPALVAGEKINIQIITGFGKLSIEPQQTGVMNQKPVMELEVAKELNTVVARKIKHVNNYNEASKGEKSQLKMVVLKKKEIDGKNLLKPTLSGNELNDCKAVIADCELKIKLHEKKAAVFNKTHKDEQGSINTTDTEIKEVSARFITAKEDHFRENPVFCEPPSGELIESSLLLCVPGPDGLAITKTAGTIDSDRAAKAEADGVEYISFLLPDGVHVDKIKVDGEDVDGLLQIHAKKGDNSQIKIDGMAVDDFRGKEYYFNDGDTWIKSEKITDLNVTKNTVVVNSYEDQACTFEQLEPEYQEEWRLQNLTPEQKTAEYESSKAGLAQQAQAMETRLKFEQVVDFEAQAQTFYNTELELLKLKYDIT